MTHPSALAGLDQVGQLGHSSISNKEQKGVGFHFVGRLERKPFIARNAHNILETGQQTSLFPQLLNQL